jgi:hypothetical protein
MGLRLSLMKCCIYFGQWGARSLPLHHLALRPRIVPALRPRDTYPGFRQVFRTVSGCVQCPPLQRSKYVKNGLDFTSNCEYEPAPLDRESYWVGVYKYHHDRYNILDVHYDAVLSWLKLMFGPFLLGIDDWSPQHAWDTLDPKKASGYWYSSTFGPKKRDVMKNYTPDMFLEDFRSFTPVLSVAEKDELRPLGKDARIYSPVPTDCAYVGNLLFGAQNEKLQETILEHPITIGARVLGGDMMILFQTLRMHGGDLNDTDGQQWDVRFALFLARLCRDLRIWLFRGKFSGLDASQYQKLVFRYYKGIYCGLNNVAGILAVLYGQHSGQTNTGNDNSFGHVAMFMLHAVRVGLSYSQFRESLLLYVNADDAVYSDRTGKFNVKYLNSCFMEYGMFLEANSFGGKDLCSLQYLACSPCWRTLGTRKILFYRFRLGKLLSSFQYNKKGQSPTDYFQKCVALCLLLFGHPEIFEVYRAKVLGYYFEQRSAGANYDVKVCTSLIELLTDDQKLFRIYTCMESCGGRVLTFSPSSIPCCN